MTVPNTQSDDRPLLAITLGDPSGIGPEIIIKALAHEDLYQTVRPMVIGDRRILERAAGCLGRTNHFEVIHEPGLGHYQPGLLSLMDLHNAACGRLSAG